MVDIKIEHRTICNMIASQDLHVHVEGVLFNVSFKYIRGPVEHWIVSAFDDSCAHGTWRKVIKVKTTPEESYDLRFASKILNVCIHKYKTMSS